MNLKIILCFLSPMAVCACAEGTYRAQGDEAHSNGPNIVAITECTPSLNMARDADTWSPDEPVGVREVSLCMENLLSLLKHPRDVSYVTRAQVESNVGGRQEPKATDNAPRKTARDASPVEDDGEITD